MLLLICLLTETIARYDSVSLGETVNELCMFLSTLM